MKRGGRKALIITLVVLVIVIGSYFSFFYIPKCQDSSCFSKAMIDCSRASYINEDSTAAWQYDILFSYGEECRVNVKALEIKSDLESQNVLKSKEMLCKIPKEGFSDYPEKKLEYCSGELKESIQDLMIKRMQLYIISSLDRLNSK